MMSQQLEDEIPYPSHVSVPPTSLTLAPALEEPAPPSGEGCYQQPPQKRMSEDSSLGMELDQEEGQSPPGRNISSGGNSDSGKCVHTYIVI